MKTALSPIVKKDNVDSDGKLQPGLYNVGYNGVMSAAPMYDQFDGKTWEDYGENELVEEGELTGKETPASIRYVFCRVSD